MKEYLDWFTAMIRFIRLFLKKNVSPVLVALVLSAAVWMKLSYAQSSTDDLRSTLTPVNTLIELLYGSHSVYVSGEGFYFEQFSVVMDKSCAGVNFLVILFCVICLLIMPVIRATAWKIMSLPIVFVGSCLITLLANTMRIAGAIFLLQFQFQFPWIASPAIHQAEGVFIYLTILISTYLLVKPLNRKISHYYAKPS